MALGFDFDETTHPDLNAVSVRELSDPDPLTMLGKLAASCARTESAVRELVKRSGEHEAELKRITTRSNRIMVSAVVVFEVLIRVLQGAGVLK